MKKLGLALGSGGSRGVAHVGFLKALEEADLQPDYICGCSIGSVMGGAYAFGLTADEIWKIVEKLRILDIISPSRQRGGLFSTKKMRDLLEKHIGDISFADLKIPFRCIAVDMVAQKIVEFSQGSLLDAVVASSTIPAVFHPTVREGARLVDGGVLERVPVPQVKKMGADVVVAVDVLGQRQGKADCPRTLGVLLEMIDMMDDHRTRRRREENADIIDFWIEPALGDMSQYSLKEVRFAYEQGREIGIQYAPKIKKALK